MNGARRLGIPKTEIEREKTHEKLYPGTELPPRGTGRMATGRGAGRGAGRRNCGRCGYIEYLENNII